MMGKIRNTNIHRKVSCGEILPMGWLSQKKIQITKIQISKRRYAVLQYTAYKYSWLQEDYNSVGGNTT